MTHVKHKARLGVIVTPRNRAYTIKGRPAERVKFNDSREREYILVSELREAAL